MSVSFTSPTFQRQGVVTGFNLSAPDYAGTPPGSGAPISFTYFAANITVMSVVIPIATGYVHWVDVAGNQYDYVQQNSDTPSIIATALANAINGAPDALVTATTSAGVLTLTPRQNTGAAINCTASDGATAQTLFELTGNELIPAISKGVLFAQSTMYRPATAPVLPAVTASQQSWLFYSSSTGWYWRNVPTPTTSDDACVGWVVANATAVIAVSSSKVGTGAEAPVIPGGPVIQGTGATGFDSGVPPAPNYAAAETNSQLVIGDMTFASARDTDGIDFASFVLFYVNEGAGTALTLTAALGSSATAMSGSAALPASTPGSVTFTFYNTTHGAITIGPGYVHSIGIGAATYEYEQLTEDTAAIVATALANLINAEADPNAMATAVGSTVVLTALQNTGGTVTCSASDGNTPATLTETEPSYVVIDGEIIEVLASNGSSIKRAQKASTAAAHLVGAKIWPVTAMTVVFALPLFSYGTPAWPTVIGQIPFTGQALVAADGWVANEIGPSPITTKCFTGQGPYAVDALGNPLAPDVGGFTAAVTTNINVAGLPYYQFGGTVTTGPAPGNTAEIDVVVTDASGVATVVYKFMGPFAASVPLNWKSVLFAQPSTGASLSFTPSVVPLNSDGAPTVSSYTVSALSVPNGTVTITGSTAATPESPYSVTLTEVGPRTLKVSDQTTYTTLEIAIEEAIVPSGAYVLGTQLHVQISSDGGSTWGDAGQGVYTPDRLDEDGTRTYFVTTIDIAGFLVMTAPQNWMARAWALTQYVDPGPAAATASSTYAVAQIGVPSNTGATLSITSPASYTDPSTGNILWQQTLTIQTPGSGDPNAWFYQVTVQQVRSTGADAPSTDYNSIGFSAAQFGQPECPWIDCANDGESHSFTLQASYAPAGSNYHFTRYIVYGVSRTATVSTPVNSWEDPTYSVRQTWPSGSSAEQDDFGAIPAGAIPLARAIGTLQGSQITGTINASHLTGIINASLIGTINASQVTGTITSSFIGAVNASQISGQINTSNLGTLQASAITGLINASNIGVINASQVTGVVTSSYIGSINASQITGQINTSNLGSIQASAITGQINTSNLASLAASAITGQINASNLGTLQASAITGTINASNIGVINASQVTGAILSSVIGTIQGSQIVGTISASYIGSITASSITGVIVTSQLAAGIMDSLSQFANGIAVVQQVTTLPSTAGLPNGALALLTTASPPTLYEIVSGTWTVITASSVLTGQLTAGDIASINASQINGVFTAIQIGMINGSQINGTIAGSNIGTINGSQVTGSITASVIGVINASQIAGQINTSNLGTLQASAIAGTIAASNIGTIASSKISGTIAASNIGTIQASLIAGTIAASNIGTIQASSITSVNATAINIGTIQDSQIGNVNVSKLVAGTALFSGTVTFENSGSGVNIQITGTTIVLNGPSCTTSLTSGSITLSSGSSSVTISSGGVAIVNGTIATTNGTKTLNVDTANWFRAYDSSTGFASVLNPAQVTTHNLVVSSGGIVALGLPTSNPGVGSGQLWCDTTDSNRVKVA